MVGYHRGVCLYHTLGLWSHAGPIVVQCTWVGLTVGFSLFWKLAWLLVLREEAFRSSAVQGLLDLVYEVCDVFCTRDLPSTPWGQPRAIAKAWSHTFLFNAP